MHWAACEEAQGHLGHAQGLSTHVMPPHVQGSVVQWIPLGMPSWKDPDWGDPIILSCEGALQRCQKVLSKAAAAAGSR